MTDHSNILRWYSGKSLDGAQLALDLLARSEAAGYWVPTASRTVRAKLSKQNVAQKIEKAHGNVFANYDHPAYRAAFGMHFGGLNAAIEAREQLAAIDATTLGTMSPRDQTFITSAREWAADFAPIAAIAHELDVRRPKPIVICGTLSPSVVANLSGKLGMQLDSIEVPETVGEWRDVVQPIKGDRQGRTHVVKVWHERIIWPPGTRHRRSRFAEGSAAGNQQCEACGHAIRDPYNWCPLVAREADGKPSSLWVGRDCARKLLGCTIDNGEAIYEGRA